MGYLVATHTDRGISKEGNQDSFCVKEAHTAIGDILMVVLCDGMGGLAKGEVASAEVVLAFSEWFDEKLPELIHEENNLELICDSWKEMTDSENKKIGNYGKENDIQLGTTLTVLLLINEQQYLFFHVGDTRIYEINQEEINQLTEDQTVVASEIKAGRLTPEEAEKDPRRSVLLQCIGSSPNVQPEIGAGKINRNTAFLLCTDGFRHEITNEGIFEELNADKLIDEKVMKKKLFDLTELVKERKETDNISSIIVKAI